VEQTCQNSATFAARRAFRVTEPKLKWNRPAFVIVLNEFRNSLFSAAFVPILQGEPASAGGTAAYKAVTPILKRL
jgi:hypothetical protein